MGVHIASVTARAQHTNLPNVVYRRLLYDERPTHSAVGHRPSGPCSRVISLLGEDPSQRTRNPYRSYFRGSMPGELLANFPWDRLQVLEMHLCTTAPCEAS